MDRRKVEAFRKESESEQLLLDSENLKLQKIVNSRKVNLALLDNAQKMFDLEFELKQKAQLKYMQAKQ
jgi:hypothetical protein